MKRTSIFLLLSLFSFVGMAQEPADSGLTRLADRARLFGERTPQEKVFVQMDNTCYFLGDTIWFSAFTRSTESGQPSKISRVLYAELWNHDGFLVERKLVEMREGRGNGFFALPDSLYSGFFELRAYTRWQLNWGEFNRSHSAHAKKWFYNAEMLTDYFRDYEKLYSRVFPVYDKPQMPGEYFRDMTLRPLRRNKELAAEESHLRLSLFPEGGNMVAGMPCRVAFEAATEEGEYCEGTVSLLMKNEKIRVKNYLGEEVTEVRTENRGRGSFTFTPEAGQSYEVVFASADGKTAKQKIKGMEKEGVSLQVNRQGDEWVFDIHTNLTQPLGMTIMHEGVTSRFAQIKNEKLKIKNDELKAGINQVTIFDEQGRVWADRLFFVTKPELTRPTIAVSGLKDEYQPFEEINLTLQTLYQGEEATPPLGEAGKGSFSLSVRDAVRQDNTFDTGNIMTEMLLASEIKGFVPHPEWFFEQDDAEHRRGLELLMMTQGWRRFAWKEMTNQDWHPTYPAEQSQTVTGSVNNYYVDNYGYAKNRKKFLESKLRREVMVLAKFTKTDDPTQTTGGKAVTEGGKFKIEFPRFYGDCYFFIAASDSTKWKRVWSEFNERRAKATKRNKDKEKRYADIAEYYVRLNFGYPRWPHAYDYYQVRLAADRSEESGDNLHMGLNDQMMEQITVRAQRHGKRNLDLKKPVYVLDAYEAGNAAMDAGLVDHLYQTIPMGYATIQNYIGDMGIDRWYAMSVYYDSIEAMHINYNILSNKKFEETLPTKEVTPIWVNEHIKPIDHVRYQDLAFIDKVYLYTDYSPRQEGYLQYSVQDQPSVEISLHRYPNWEQRITYRNRRYILHGFAYQEDFYHPDYKRNPPKEGQKDYRRTLYWNPDLKLDEQGEAHITLYNNSQRTRIHVEANGMTSEGGFLYNK